MLKFSTSVDRYPPVVGWWVGVMSGFCVLAPC